MYHSTTTSVPIPISKNNITYNSKPIYNTLKRNPVSFECKLDNNIFDPSKNSPPNPWLQKLESRIKDYYTN